RALRSPVEAGSIEYSAVTQPRPRPCIQRGTESLTEAVQITLVLPIEISADPSAVSTNSGSIVTGRMSAGPRSELREAGIPRVSQVHLNATLSTASLILLTIRSASSVPCLPLNPFIAA